MAIPRFTARITEIQVPSMKNYQEEQNASIAKSLANFGYTMLGSAIKLYPYMKKAEAENVYYERYKQMQEETSMDKTLTKVT